MDTSSYFTLDDALWPFVRVQLQGSATNEQYTEYLDALARCLARRELHVLVLDMLEVRFASREQLHQMAQWMAQHEAQLRAYALGTGYVVASPFIRLGMNVVFSLSPRVVPYFLTPTAEPALAWAARRLEEAGLHAGAHRVRQHYALTPALAS